MNYLSGQKENNLIDSSVFIEEWLNHFNINYQTEIKIPNSNQKLDYYIPSANFGVVLAEWKKPISVRVVNRAINALDKLNLSELVIIAHSIGDYANSTLNRLDRPIKAILSSGLSDLAMTIASLTDIKSSGMLERA